MSMMVVKDATWSLIQQYAKENSHVVGIAQSRNRGHQSSVLAGMYEAAEFADIVITMTQMVKMILIV